MDFIDIALPTNAETMALPDPTLYNYWKDNENRVIWLDSDITQEYTLEVIKRIMMWNREDNKHPLRKRKPIYIYIFCNGGDLDTTFGMISCIESSKTPVIGINCGVAYSGGAFTLLACHKRYAMPRSQILFHKGSGGFSGDYNSVCAQLLAYQNQINELVEFVKERTNYKAEDIEEKIQGEWFIGTKEALENGVIDKVINSLEEL